jgi:hypothetical protein
VSVPQRAATLRGQPPADAADSGLAGIRSQALFRELNEAIHRQADKFAVADDLELVCECEHGDCFARLSISADDYEAVRRFPTRFLTKPGHVSDTDRIVEETARYEVVEKIGPSAEAAILLDPRKHALPGSAV